MAERGGGVGAFVGDLREGFNIAVSLVLVVAGAAFGLGFLTYMASKIAGDAINVTTYFGPVTGMWGTLASISLLAGVMVLMIPAVGFLFRFFTQAKGG